MSEKNLAYRFSNFNTINLEIKDTDYYCKEIDLDSLDFEFNFNIVFVDNYTLRIFIHYLYSIEEELDGEKGMLSIYHTDHILMVDFEKSQKDKKYEISFIANLLGTAIVMSKGYFDNITKGYKINDVRLPVFNPVELINFKYKDAIIDDIISIDAPKKKKRKAKAVKH